MWDDFSKLNGTIHNGENANVSDNSYHKFKEDISLMKRMGLKHYRLSISWARILPNGTTDKGINGHGVAYYNELFSALIEAGITPWVTLFHWDTPSALHNRSDTGSWLSTDIIEAFDNYADFVFAVYGDRVKHWITLNEPWTYSLNGYGSGDHAPGRCSTNPKCLVNGGGGNTSTEPYIVAHHLLLAHARASKTYRTKYQKQQGGVIGFTSNTDYNLPYNASDPDDREAAERQTAFALGWFYDPIFFGRYPEEMLEYISDIIP